MVVVLPKIQNPMRKLKGHVIARTEEMAVLTNLLCSILALSWKKFTIILTSHALAVLIVSKSVEWISR